MRIISYFIFCIVVLVTYDVKATQCSMNNYSLGSVVENKHYPLPFTLGNEVVPFEILNNFSSLEKEKVFGKVRFKLPPKVKIQAPSAGRIQFLPSQRKIKIISSARSSSYVWTLYPISPESMGGRFIESGDFVEPGDIVGALDYSYENVAPLTKSCPLKSTEKWVSAFLDVEVEHKYASGLELLRNPRSTWSLPDYIRPKVKKIHIFRNGTGEPFLNSDNFFNKPVVRGHVQVGISAYDRSPLFFKKGHKIYSRGKSSSMLGINRVRLEIHSILSRRSIYTRDFYLFRQLKREEKENNKFFIYHKYTKKPYILLTRKEIKHSSADFWNTLAYPNGIYEIKVRVWDKEGNWVIKKQEVLVNN